MNTTDLNDPDSPDQIPPLLRRAADKMRESASELASAGGDKGAGAPWKMIARELDRAATRIEKELSA